MLNWPVCRTPYISIGSANDVYQAVMNMSMPLRAAGEENSAVYWSGETVLILTSRPMSRPAWAVACAITSAATLIGLVAITIFWPSTPASAASCLAFSTS